MDLARVLHYPPRRQPLRGALPSATTPDQIFGIGASDHIETNAGDDFASDGTGDDSIGGQAGNDDLRGGTGRDFIDGRTGRDFIGGGIGSDSINAVEPRSASAEADVVDCGEDANGLDVDFANVDRLDTVRNCEKVFVR